MATATITSLHPPHILPTTIIRGVEEAVARVPITTQTTVVLAVVTYNSQCTTITITNSSNRAIIHLTRKGTHISNSKTRSTISAVVQASTKSMVAKSIRTTVLQAVSTKIQISSRSRPSRCYLPGSNRTSLKILKTILARTTCTINIITISILFKIRIHSTATTITSISNSSSL